MQAGVHGAGTLCDAEALFGSCEYALCLGIKRLDMETFGCVLEAFAGLNGLSETVETTADLDSGGLPGCTPLSMDMLDTASDLTDATFAADVRL